jgi:putative ABC transport system permease protein
LPPDPSAAFFRAQHTANNFEARVAGSAALADNLAARLDAVRADSLYAHVLFLFLGIPGVILALLVTLAVASSGSERRRREQALLRLRGASLVQLLRLAAIEAIAVAGLGVVLGLLLAITVVLTWWRMANLGLAVPWFILVGAIGVGFGVAASLVPAWMDATGTSIAAARAEADRPTPPLWQRLYLDAIILVAGGLVLWMVARSGYEIVLAPEGVAQTSVHYEAFLAPLCFWIGAGLLWLRLSRLALGPGQSVVAALVLLRTSGDAEAVAAAARMLVAKQGGKKVTTLGETQTLISSSLTAVDLRGLTALELAFSVLMIAGVTGLVLALGLAERRRSVTILSALGATQR